MPHAGPDNIDIHIAGPPDLALIDMLSFALAARRLTYNVVYDAGLDWHALAVTWVRLAASCARQVFRRCVLLHLGRVLDGALRPCAFVVGGRFGAYD